MAAVREAILLPLGALTQRVCYISATLAFPTTPDPVRAYQSVAPERGDLNPLPFQDKLFAL